MTTIPQLELIANIDGDELFYVIDDPTGAPLNRRATVDQVVARVFALPGFAETVDDRVAQLLQASNGTIQLTYDDAGNLLSIGVGSIAPSQVSGLDEHVRDLVGATLVQGDGVAIEVDDEANTITISATGAPPVQAPTATATGTASTQGVAASFVVMVANAPEVWIVLVREGADEGARISVQAPGGTVALTPQQTGSYRIRVYSAQTGGTQLFESTAFTVSAPSATGTISGAATTDGVAATFAVTFANVAQAFAVLARDGVEQGARVAVTTSGATVSLTPSGVGTYTARLFSALTGGDLLAETQPFIVGTGQAGVVPLMDIVWAGFGAPANSISTAGLAFAPGDLLPSDPVVLKQGVDVYRVQISPTMLHPDGSIRTAIVAAELPAIADNVKFTTTLVKGEAHPSPGANLAVSAGGLAGRTAQIVVQRNDGLGGTPWAYDPLAAAAAVSGHWVQGPLMAQKRVVADVPATAVDQSGVQNVTSMRLIVDVTLLKDGSLWCEFAMSNDVARNIAPGGGAGLTANTGYRFTLTQDGTVTANYTVATGLHRYYSRFMRLVHPGTLRGTLPGGGLAPRFASMDPPTRYLAERAGVISNFDVAAGVDPSVVTAVQFGDAYNNILSNPSWDVPFEGRFISRVPGGAGIAKIDGIGPNTDAQSDFLAGALREAQTVMYGLAEAAACFSTKMWLRDGGVVPGTGGWANARDPVTLNLYSPGDARFFPGTQEGNWKPSFSHQPNHFFLAYILSGRRLILDEINAQALWMFHSWPTTPIVGWLRGLDGSWDTATGEGMNVMRADQYRTIGWRLRDCVYAWYVLPASEQPWPNFWPDVVTGNFAWLNSQAPRWNVERGELRGILWDIVSGQGTSGMNYGYNSEFIVHSMILAARWGAPGAMTFLRDYHMQWLMNRFLNEPAFRPAQLSRIQLDWGTNNPQTWAELQSIQGIQMQAPPIINWGDGGNPGYDMVPVLVRNLADLCNLFPGDWRVWRAYRWFWKAMAEAPDLATIATSIPAGRSVLSRIVQRTNTKHMVVPFGWTINFVAPTVRSGQTFTVREDASSVQPVGQVMTQGGMPWGFAITGGTGAGLFAVDEFGALRPTVALDFDAAPDLGDGNRGYTLLVTATNKWGTSAPALLTMRVANVEVIPPTLLPAGPFTIFTTAALDAAVGTLTVTGSPSTLSIVSGNTGGLFTVAGTQIRVAASLSAAAGQARTLRVRATNASGISEQDVVVNIVLPLAPPNIAGSGGSVTGVEGAAAGALTRTITNVGGASTTWNITAGNASGQFALDVVDGFSATLRTAQVLPAGSYSVTVQAANATASSSAVVSFSISGAPYVHGLSQPVVLALSTRRVRDNYSGPLVRAIRVADSAETDIGFAGAGNLLDTTALTTFAQGGLVELLTWYDQSASGQHFNAGAQRPRLTTAAGVPLTIGTNNRPSISFEQNNNQSVFNPAFTIRGGRDITLTVAQRKTHNNWQQSSMFLFTWHNDAADTVVRAALTNTFFVRGGVQINEGGNIITSTPIENDENRAYGFTMRGVGAGTSNMSLDGATNEGAASGLSGSFPVTGFARIGGVNGTGEWFRGRIAEVFVLGSMPATDLNTLTANQKAWIG